MTPDPSIAGAALYQWPAISGVPYSSEAIPGQTLTPSRQWSARQRASHAPILGHHMPDSAASRGRLVPDAIIVPASRPAHNLDHAVTLARAACCHLVVLCSRDTNPADVRALLAARSFSAATVIEMPRWYGHEFFKFETTQWSRHRLPDACSNRNSDLSVKRNVGLVLARMLGWRRIFFMDDDIRDLDTDALLETVSMVGGAQSRASHYYSVGMSASEFPDNSVVCHARRAIGEYQDVFVSGSALAVDCTVSFAFFPDIYNEDWLFFYRDAAQGRLGSSTHRATQLRYNPFADPRRAATQEFGDVIAEGLYALLDEGLGAGYATNEYWDLFLADRRQIIDVIIDNSSITPPFIRSQMTDAMEMARKCLSELQPNLFVEFLQRWRDDLAQWEETMRRIPCAESMSDALRQLKLDAHAFEVTGSTSENGDVRSPCDVPSGIYSC